MAGPTLMAHGTPTQQKRVPRADAPRRRGRGASSSASPGSGSDLASLSTRAERDGDEWVLDGQKVWTSSAHTRRLGHLPGPHRPRRRRSTPASPTSSSTCTRPASTCGRCGRSTAPSTSTRCSSTACACRRDHVVGDVGDGWRVAMTTLTAERTVDRRGRPDRLAGGRGPGPAPRSRPATPCCARRSRASHTREMIQRWLVYRVRTAVAKGVPPGPEAAVLKLREQPPGRARRLAAHVDPRRRPGRSGTTTRPTAASGRTCSCSSGRAASAAAPRTSSATSSASASSASPASPTPSRATPGGTSPRADASQWVRRDAEPE